MKKNKMFGVGIGTTSVMLIFVVVCLSVLAVMACIVVRSDTAIVDKKTSYSMRAQMADNVASETLAAIDDKLYQLNKEKIPFINEKTCRSIMDDIKGIQVDYNTGRIAYKVGLEQNSSLDVLLEINLDKNKQVSNKQRYKVLKWKVVTRVSDIGDNNLNVWQ